MSDETARVPVQMSADVLKGISTTNEQTKATLENGTAVTISFPPEFGSKFTELRKDFEAYQQSQVEEWRNATDRFIKVSEMRISFYEKLILLAGGSFALSLTFVGSLQRHALQGNILLAMGRLKWAWFLLLVCIVFSWLHNLYRCGAVDNLTASTARNIAAMQHTWASALMTRTSGLFKQGKESPPVGFGDAVARVGEQFGELSTKSRNDATEYVNTLRRLSLVSAILGGLALLSIITAFAFMVVFAIKNAGLL
jgi:hypothetical protein